MRRLFQYLKNKRRIALYGGLTCGVCFLLIYFILPFAYSVPEQITSGPGDSLILLDRNGQQLDHWVRKDYYRHLTVNLDIIPNDLIQATLSAEDKRFYEHGGIDFRATLRAIKDSIDQGKFVSGASTITQQTIKITSPPAKRNFMTKIREQLTARHMEMTHDKKEILSAYFNHLDYGNLSQGPLQAARYYFGKPLGELSLAECALLAGLPQAPSRLNPRRHPEAAIKRRNWILDRMQIVYALPKDRIQLAKKEPLQLRKRSQPRIAPHLISLVKKSTKQKKIQTSLSSSLQKDLTHLAREQIKRLEDKHIQHAAIVVIHNSTGEVLAHVGSPFFNAKNGGQINAAHTPRSPGSALKPFTYLLAFENGGMTPATIIPDIPTSFAGNLGGKSFINYNRLYQGPVTIHHALANSLNVPAIRTLNNLGGAKTLQEKLQQFGITTLKEKPAHYGLGLTLGSGEVNLIELTNAYACLARAGKFIPTSFLLTKPSPTLIKTTPSYWMLAETMRNNVARIPSFGDHSNLKLPFPCAVKTGTSSDFRDNWCLGFTAEFTVGVWVGNLDNTPMRGVSGVSGAGPLFHATMMRLHENHQPTWFQRPENMKLCHIDRHTGKQLSKPSQHSVELNLPTEKLPLFSQKEDYSQDKKVILDARYKEWLNASGDASRFTIQQHSSLTTEAPRIISPSNHARYLLDPDLPNNGRFLPLKTDSPEKIIWSSPTLQIEKNTATLTPGKHHIHLTNTETGQQSSCIIHVQEL